MSNRTYDLLKISALIVIPAIATFVGTLGETWNWTYSGQIVATINALSVLLGTIVTKLSSDYSRKKARK